MHSRKSDKLLLKKCHSCSSHCCLTAPTCPKNQEFFYNIRACNTTCRSITESDPRCGVDDASVEGCGCPEGTYLNQGNTCTPKADCECHHLGGVSPPGPVVIDGHHWWDDPLITQYLQLYKMIQYNLSTFYLSNCSLCENGELTCSTDCGKSILVQPKIKNKYELM